MLTSDPTDELTVISVPSLRETLGSIPVLRVELEFQATRHSKLPRFLGSTLRGSLARATKLLTCSLTKERCERCLLRERCVYSVLFETPRPPDSVVLRGQAKLPHPLVVDPPSPRDEPWSEGELLTFELLLFGAAIDHLPYLLAAAEQMGNRGLGKSRHPFEMIAARTVSFGGAKKLIYRPGTSIRAVESEPIERHLDQSAPARSVEIELVTPTRLVVKGSLTSSPPPEVFFRALAMRALAMLHFHCGQKVDLDIAGVIECAETLEMTKSDLRVVNVSRYSSRQRSKVPLDGLVGTLELGGEELLQLWPLLAAGEVLRVGKGTIFGLGKYGIKE